jgi:hypothetical protein
MTANSYGFDGNIPTNALYGEYDTENGEWTGTFYNSLEDAQAAAKELKDDPRVGIVSVTDPDDWLD